MTRTTYFASAPDGTELTRKTDRKYTHAVLLEGENGWRIAGFCGRLDLAHKKQTEHPGSIVVEAQVLGVVSADETASEATEDAEPTGHEAVGASEREQSVDDKIRNAKITGPERLGTIGELVHELLMDVDNTYVEIVAEVKRRFPAAKTTARSVASVAAVLRKKGASVPVRRKAKAP
ncbi:hypothetical protein [Jannaschia rubra]|uniref:Uncharacterized protein n=1 Tax=Jannaschia rubra TaxID=282197 RepID=A0A0M6XNB3_9RHOB|nr:hypothetical protein [Jannaschia rubra]CTQ32067.1 hypothetical protein JAN5088_00828 [Jannaschia rubra]SFG38403.1 hypothetical protein SAMN04488517_104166 [Jannaschia rubra]